LKSGSLIVYNYMIYPSSIHISCLLERREIKDGS
jgi:hypothetical protein